MKHRVADTIEKGRNIPKKRKITPKPKPRKNKKQVTYGNQYFNDRKANDWLVI